MQPALPRLLRPRSIAVIGGGAWCRATIAQCRKIGFTGDIWPVHPTADSMEGLPVWRDVAGLPAAPDAAFIGVNRRATVDIVQALSRRGAGGAVCFASGFREAQSEDAGAADLQEALIRAAGDMPFLGPNCYGFINYLDGALLWPDQHGGQRVDRGVAIITQSSNIAINLTMQRRSVPLAYIVTAGNQAKIGIADIGCALLEDSRVTALGLHIEGFGDLRAFERLAATADRLGKRIIALKIGKSDQARHATVSHTASLAGGDVGAACFLRRLGIARAADLAGFLEALKLLHVTGPLPSNRIATMSCSGGEASLAADSAYGRDLCFPELNRTQRTELRAALGPMVALANPLDYHTYIWRDTGAMTATFAAMIDPGLAITLLIVDFPRADRCDPADWAITIDTLIAAKTRKPGHVGMVATLPETMPEEIAERLLAAGIVPFCGLQEALAACEMASLPRMPPAGPVCLPTATVSADLLTEAEAKARLAAYGLPVPAARRCTARQLPDAVARVGFPLVLKAEGLAHKTEAGAVALGLNTLDAVQDAARRMPGDRFLIEQMITGTVAELLIGVVKDPAHGFVMTLAAGGTLTEITGDSASFLLPAAEGDIDQALGRLRISRLLAGYRGAPAADIPALHRAIRAVEDYVLENAEGLEEIEINPLLCTPQAAIAADALLRRKDTP